MSVLPSTANQSQRFITDQPDWSKGVNVTDYRVTAINLSRSGLEVRQRQRLAPHVQIEYVVSALTNDEYFARAQQVILDARAPLVVPMWGDVEFVQADTTAAAHTDLEIGNARRKLFFRAGDWIYWNDGSSSQFRQIATITDSTNFVLETTGSPEQMFEDDPVYPCLVCEQISHDVDFTRYAPESREIKLKFRSIDAIAVPTSYATTIPEEGNTVSNPDAGG